MTVAELQRILDSVPDDYDVSVLTSDSYDARIEIYLSGEFVVYKSLAEIELS